MDKSYHDQQMIEKSSKIMDQSFSQSLSLVMVRSPILMNEESRLKNNSISLDSQKRIIGKSQFNEKHIEKIQDEKARKYENSSDNDSNSNIRNKQPSERLQHLRPDHIGGQKNKESKTQSLKVSLMTHKFLQKLKLGSPIFLFKKMSEIQFYQIGDVSNSFIRFFGGDSCVIIPRQGNYSFLKKTQTIKICFLLFNFISLLILLILTPLINSIEFLLVDSSIICIIYLTINFFIQTNLAYFKGGEIISDRNHIIKKYFSKASTWVISLFEIKAKYQHYTVFLRIVIMILLLAHITGCIFIIIGQESNNKITWMSKFQSVINNQFDIYIASIYWSIVTMITLGYGDIVPQSTNERIYVICMAFVSCGVFAYSVNTIGNIKQALIQDQLLSCNIIGETLREKKRSKDDFNNKMMVLQSFMKTRSINRGLREQIFRHYNYLFKHSTSSNAAGIQLLNQMPESIKQTLRIELYYQLIKNQSYFSETFDHKFLYNLCPLVKEIQLGSGMSVDETIFESFNESVLFVIQGEIGLNLTNKMSSSYYSGQIFKVMLTYLLTFYLIVLKFILTIFTMKIKQKGDIINLHLFVTGQQQNLIPKLKTLSVVTIAYIERSSIIQLLNDFPLEKEKFFQSQDKVCLYDQKDLLRLKCKCCGKTQHEASGCQFLHKNFNKNKIIHNANLSIFQERDKQYIRKRIKSIAALKFLMVEMSPDYNPVIQEFTQKSRNTQIQGNQIGEYSQNNQIGTVIQIAHPVNDQISNQLITSQKNHYSSNMIIQPDITSLLQPYSITEINQWTPSHRQSFQNFKGIELIQKYKQKYQSMKSKTIGSQQIIQPSTQLDSIQTSILNKAQKPTCQDLDIYDSSLMNSERQYQKPKQIDNQMPFNKYFNEEDIQGAYQSNSSIDQPILVGHYPSSNIVFSQPQRVQAKHFTYGQKVQSQQNQLIFEESRFNFAELLSPKINSTSSNIFLSHQKASISEEAKNSDPTTIGKINSDLSVSIRPESLLKSASKRTHTNQNCTKQNSLRSLITGGLIKPIEYKGDYPLKKQQIVTSHNIPSQTHLGYLEEKCCEIDIRKDYVIYFSHQNCNIILQKYNDKIMKNTLKQSGKRIAHRNNRRVVGQRKPSQSKINSKIINI